MSYLPSLRFTRIEGSVCLPLLIRGRAPACVSLKAPPYSRSKCAAKAIMVRPPERAIAEKRRNYFAAGSTVVWDVDLLSEEVIKSYCAELPETPTIFRRGDVAQAEPAVPGWRMQVNEMLE